MFCKKRDLFLHHKDLGQNVLIDSLLYLDVMEGGFLHADFCGWPLVKLLGKYYLAIAASLFCFLFHYSFRLLSFACFGLSMELQFL